MDTGAQRVPLVDGNHIEVLDKFTHYCVLVDINPDLLEVPSQFRLIIIPPGNGPIFIAPGEKKACYY